MGFSLDNIKALLDGKEKLSEVADKNAARIEEEMIELQGALNICRKIQSDPAIDCDFSVDMYWNAMVEEERQGSKFFDTVKDYIDFESVFFFGMWKTVFFTDLKEFLSGKKFADLCVIQSLRRSGARMHR